MKSKSAVGETPVVKMHSENGEHDEKDCRAVACFDHALVDVGLADDAFLRKLSNDYFALATTATMARYPGSADDVPSCRRTPRWAWDGLQQ